MDPRPCGIPDSVPGNFDVMLGTTGKRSNPSTANLVGYSFNCLEIPSRGDWEAGLDDVDAQRFEFVCDAQLFSGVHAATRRLLAITQGSIEYQKTVGHAINSHVNQSATYYKISQTNIISTMITACDLISRGNAVRLLR